MSSVLYMVATPIGNFDDMTMRAVKTLSSVDVVACEDTRHTGMLLERFGIKKRTISCHAHNEEASAKGIIGLLEEGMDVAYCSDAGTPGISDPGARLAEAVRKAGFKVVPIPGCSAVVTLLSACGKSGKSFTFEGFLSPKRGRREKRLTELISRNETFVIYESPYRIVKTLKEIAMINGNLTVAIGREMTKAFEEILVMGISDAVEEFEKRESIKGEFAVAVIPAKEEETDDNA